MPATFSAARGRAGRRGFLSRCPSAKITRPTRAAVGTVSWARVPAEVHDRRGGLSASPFCPWPAQVRPCHGDMKMTNKRGSWILPRRGIAVAVIVIVACLIVLGLTSGFLVDLPARSRKA